MAEHIARAGHKRKKERKIVKISTISRKQQQRNGVLSVGHISGIVRWQAMEEQWWRKNGGQWWAPSGVAYQYRAICGRGAVSAEPSSRSTAAGMLASSGIGRRRCIIRTRGSAAAA
jgi:hypothetical protein